MQNNALLALQALRCAPCSAPTCCVRRRRIPTPLAAFLHPLLTSISYVLPKDPCRLRKFEVSQWDLTHSSWVVYHAAPALQPVDFATAPVLFREAQAIEIVKYQAHRDLSKQRRFARSVYIKDSYLSMTQLWRQFVCTEFSSDHTLMHSIKDATCIFHAVRGVSKSSCSSGVCGREVNAAVNVCCLRTLGSK